MPVSASSPLFFAAIYFFGDISCTDKKLIVPSVFYWGLYSLSAHEDFDFSYSSPFSCVVRSGITTFDVLYIFIEKIPKEVQKMRLVDEY